MRLFLSILIIALAIPSAGQERAIVRGTIMSDGKVVPSASITVNQNNLVADSNGHYIFRELPAGIYIIQVSGVGYRPAIKRMHLKAGETATMNFNLDANSSGLAEVIVTAVSRATELRRNPVPVAVVSRKEMNTRATGNIIDAITRGLPGVSTVTTGPNISKPFIRGLGYNRVLTMYDGIRQEGQQWGDEHGIEIDAYGIERAEVVKGPASLTYGSDATAGVINMIPALPEGAEGKLKGEILTDYQSNNAMAATSLGLSYKRNDWKYALRATGKIARDYRNKADGLVYNTGYREYHLSGKVRTDKKWGYAQVAATLYNNIQEIPDGSRDSSSRRFTKQILESDLDDIKNRPIVSNNELRSYSITPLHQHIQHYRLYTHNKLKAGAGDFQLTAGFQQSIRREYNHPSMPRQAGLYVVLNTLNYGLKYNLPDIKNYELTVGINGMFQNNKSRDATDFPIPDYDLSDIGSYLFVKRTVGKFDLSGGVRYDNRNLRWNNFYVQNNPVTGFDRQVAPTDTAGASLQFPAFNRNYSGVTGSFGVAYNITERVVLKANIARGYRSPSITEVGSNGLDPGARIVYQGNRNFEPEFSLQQDIGMIAYLSDVNISVELFNNNIDHYIYQAKLYDDNGEPVVIVPGNATYKYQQARARLYGGEVSIQLHPRSMEWLTFNNSVAYVTGINKNDQLLKIYGDKAKYLPFIPPLHFNSSVKATSNTIYGIFSKAYATVEADAFGKQDRFYGADDTETFTEGYMLLNIGCGATIVSRQGREQFQVFFQVTNVLNRVYQSNQSRLKYFEYFAATPDGRSGIYNMGRNIGVKVIVPFSSK
ncbi:MAG: TonB-dependent receptor [Chitinophagaceae bacterium]|nr:TonB-dependent receptor [Chitinophagaceae bacterium]